MKTMACVMVVAFGMGCGGRYPEPQVARSPAEQYARDARSSVPPAAAQGGYGAAGWRDTGVSDEELAALAAVEDSGGGESIETSSIAQSSTAAVRNIAASVAVRVAGDDTPAAPSAAELAAGQGVSAVRQAAPAAAPALPEQLVVEGWIGLEVDDVQKTAVAIRAQVVASGGRVVSENLGGSGEGWSGDLEIRLPPQRAASFLGWLDEVGDVRSRRVQGTDVSRTLFDQELALQNLTLTMARLQKLLERQDMAMKDVLAVEVELTRVRGEIERIKGEQRFLQDRVALATLHVSLSRPRGVVLGAATTKLFPGPRLSTLVLLTPDGRERVRYGGGVAIGLGLPRVTAELDVFAGPELADGSDEDAAVVATVGGAFYSDHLGRGRRRFGNPYIGLRLGYAYLGGSAFAAGGEVGVELFKHRYVLVDANVRVLGLIGDQSDAAVVGGLSTVFAF
jgi:hypothetical protein